MRRLLRSGKEVLALLLILVAFPLRILWRARRDRTSLEETLFAIADDAYAKMSPQMRAAVDAERAAATNEALRVVEDVAGEAVEAGRARINIEHSAGIAGQLITLEPLNARACRVSVAADYPPQIEMWLGPAPTAASYEFWRDDRAENLRRLRELLEAVVDGRYAQTVETHKRNRFTVTGRFDLPSGEHMHTDVTGATGAVNPNEVYTLQFEPYCAIGPASGDVP